MATSIKISAAYGVVHKHEGYSYWHWAHEGHQDKFGSLNHAHHNEVGAATPEGYKAFAKENPTEWKEYLAGLNEGGVHEAAKQWMAATKERAKERKAAGKVAPAPTLSFNAYGEPLVEVESVGEFGEPIFTLV